MGAVDDGRLAFDQHRWGDAWRSLSSVPVDDLQVEDLDRLATAAYLTGRDDGAFDVWARAHLTCVDEGAVHRAAHHGMNLAQGFGFKGDLARCRGWVDRTARLLEDAGIDCVEQGYLEHAVAMLRLLEDGDVAGALGHFVQAGKIAARFAHRELATLARIGEGRMLVYLGDVREGLAMLDEAMVSIEARELSPMAIGDAYCTVIDACSELQDVTRCWAWTESFRRWCDTQQELVLYRGHCFLHGAEALTTLGRWSEALAEARRACARLASPVHPIVLAAAHRVEADLLRLAGRLDEAEAAYGRAAALGSDPQPGLALLRAAQGRADAAAQMIRRAVGESDDPIALARLLAPCGELALAVGDVPGAAGAAEQLREVAARLGTPLIRARATCLTGAVLLAEGDPARALVELRRGFRALHDLGARLDAAGARLLVARACAALGDDDGAHLESRAAEQELADLRASLAPSSGRADGLTEREVEVLVLAARGRSNRDIASQLVISEKTVASHLGHIFTKLGVPSRSAAAAYAYDNGLVQDRQSG